MDFAERWVATRTIQAVASDGTESDIVIRIGRPHQQRPAPRPGMRAAAREFAARLSPERAAQLLEELDRFTDEELDWDADEPVDDDFWWAPTEMEGALGLERNDWFGPGDSLAALLSAINHAHIRLWVYREQGYELRHFGSPELDFPPLPRPRSEVIEDGTAAS